MSAMTGYITYINYVAGSKKGGINQGDVFNGVYQLGAMSAERQSYTGVAVSETQVAVAGGSVTVSGSPVTATKITADWGPVASVTSAKVGATAVTPILISGADIYFAATDVSADDSVKILYVYDNVVVPQNDLPVLNATLDSVSLTAHARRIAVYYSQIAAFQAKTDYGFDLGSQLAEQAVGELSYEIDSEVVQLLSDNAEDTSDLAWNRTIPVGVSKAEHYEGFAELVEIGKQKVYDRTRKFAPNYMIIASNILPILTFIKGWTAAPVGVVNGPYFAGTLNSIKVYVSPAMAAGKFVLGVNGGDAQTSAAVYAPYMPIVPTQLLQYADGGTTQGFSTLYDLKILSKYTSTNDAKEYSPLLIKGSVTGTATAIYGNTTSPVYTATASV